MVMVQRDSHDADINEAESRIETPSMHDLINTSGGNNAEQSEDENERTNKGMRKMR